MSGWGDALDRHAAATLNRRRSAEQIRTAAMRMLDTPQGTTASWPFAQFARFAALIIDQADINLAMIAVARDSAQRLDELADKHGCEAASERAGHEARLEVIAALLGGVAVAP